MVSPRCVLFCASVHIAVSAADSLCSLPTTSQDFTSDTVDVCVLLVIRLVLLLVLIRIGVSVGTPKLDDIDAGTTAPLLINQGADQLHQLASAVRTQSGHCTRLMLRPRRSMCSHVLAPCRTPSQAKKSHLESYDRKKVAEIKKNIVIGTMFVVATSAQIYLGVKVISFHGHWDDHNVRATRCLIA